PPTTSPASALRPKSSPANVAATRAGTNPPTAQLSTASVSHHVAPATRPAPSPHIMLRTRILRHRSHLVTFRKVCRAGFCRPRHAAGPIPPGTTLAVPPRPETLSRVGIHSPGPNRQITLKGGRRRL